MEECNDFHLALTLGAEERIYVVYFLNPQIEQPSAQYLEEGSFGSTGWSRSRGVVFFQILVGMRAAGPSGIHAEISCGLLPDVRDVRAKFC